MSIARKQGKIGPVDPLTGKGKKTPESLLCIIEFDLLIQRECINPNPTRQISPPLTSSCVRLVSFLCRAVFWSIHFYLWRRNKNIILGLCNYVKKLKVLSKIDKSEPLEKIACELGVRTLTVPDWKKN